MIPGFRSGHRDQLNSPNARVHFQPGLKCRQILLVGGHPGEVFANENTFGVGGPIEGNLGGKFIQPGE